MKQKKIEPIVARILFKYVNGQDREGRDIYYLYNKESFEELGIPLQKLSTYEFLSIGDIIELEGFKCKVVNMNIRFESEMADMSGGFGINTNSPSEPTDFNCQIGVFVNRIGQDI